MASPKKRTPYAVVRDDNTYVIYDLTKDDYEHLSNSLVSEAKFCKLSIGILKLSDIRSVIEQKPEPKAKKEKQLETGTPDLDVTAIAWLKEQERLAEEFDEYKDVEGGRFS